MQGLAENTNKIFDSLSKLNCINSYTLIGGTALSSATRQLSFLIASPSKPSGWAKGLPFGIIICAFSISEMSFFGLSAVCPFQKKVRNKSK